MGCCVSTTLNQRQNEPPENFTGIGDEATTLDCRPSTSIIHVSDVLEHFVDTALHSVNEFLLKKTLGKGSYGTVLLVEDQNTRVLYALKAIPRKNAEASRALSTESSILQMISHRHILKLYKVLDDPNLETVYLVLEYMGGGSAMRLNKDGVAEGHAPFSEDLARSYMRQIVAALVYLHRNNVAHGDIKPDNILCDTERKVVKLGDFGSARKFARAKAGGDVVKTFFGTLAFMPPELLDGSAGEGIRVNGFACDIWALGITLYVFLWGQTPIQGPQLTQLYRWGKASTYPIEFPDRENFSAELLNLLQRMLCRDILGRITASELADHAWLTQISTLPTPLKSGPGSQSWQNVVARSPQLTGLSPSSTGKVNGIHSILIVEDVTTQREILRRFFQNSIDHEAMPDVTIDCVADGKDAVVAATKTAYTLILMDIHMYEMNGLEATQLIRDYECQTKAPRPAVIVGLSADPHEALADYCKDVGMNDVVPKPITISQVKDLCAAYGFVSSRANALAGTAKDTKNASAYTDAYDKFLRATDGSQVVAEEQMSSSLSELTVGEEGDAPTPGIARMLMLVERRERREELRRAPAVSAGMVIVLAALSATLNGRGIETSHGNWNAFSADIFPKKPSLRLRRLPEFKYDYTSGERQEREQEAIRALEQQEKKTPARLARFYQYQRQKAARLRGIFLVEIEAPLDGMDPSVSPVRSPLAADVTDVKATALRAMLRARKHHGPKHDLNAFVNAKDAFAVVLGLMNSQYVLQMGKNYNRRAPGDWSTMKSIARAIEREMFLSLNLPTETLAHLQNAVNQHKAATKFRLDVAQRVASVAPPICSEDVLSVVVSVDQNRRESMEDTHQVYFTDDPDEVVVGVFDGHGGAEAAQYAKDVLTATAVATSGPVDWVKAFRKCDDLFCAKATEADCDAGTTALIVHVKKGKVTVAGVGDCMAVLYRKGIGAIPLNALHTTDIEEERKSVIERGGMCLFNKGKLRVNGMLIVTRAIGDRPCREVLSNEPHVTEYPLGPRCTDQFIIVASDGLWNYVTPVDACNVVCEVTEGMTDAKKKRDAAAGKASHSNPTVPPTEEENDEKMLLECTDQDICDMLVFEAKEAKSVDNITVVLIRL